MPQKTEAGHIGGRVHSIPAADLRSGLVQSCHGTDGGCHVFRGRLAHAICGAQQPHTQRFGQQQLVSRLAGIVCVQMMRVHKAGHRQAVFDAGVCNGMTSGQNAPGLGYLFGSAAQDLAQNVQVHIFRETHQIEGSFHLATHGIHVAQGVGRCDLPEGIGVIHHGWEKVHRLHQGQIFCNAVDGGIIPAVIPHQQIRVLFAAGQLFQNAAQHTGTQLCRAAAPGTEYDFFILAHARSPSSNCVRTPFTR